MRSTLATVSALAVLISAASTSAQANHAHKLPIHWNRLYDYDEVVGIMKKMQATWPSFVTMESVGRSYEDRDLWVLTVNNAKTGGDRTKPAYYSDANIHGNEVQGAEANLYMVWYLMENYGRIPKVTELVDRVAFYVVATVNPDSRAAWFRDANGSSSQRGPQRPFDDDLDGQFDEDPAEDLNGDGEISMMRVKVPLGQGSYRLDEKGEMERVTGEQQGDYLVIGREGIDNDGDGRINEDGPGYYDMNRNWPSGWNPTHLQGGAGEYPLSHPETRAIAEFIAARPNIAGVQAFHNTGGMILRGPGTVEYGEYPRQDVAVYDKLGKDGEFMLPFYRYMIIHKDLYSVSGGFVNWTYEGLGIFSFTNELWTSDRMMQSRDRLDDEGRKKWTDLLTMGEYDVPWTPYDHPFYGQIEIGGGSRKMTGRVPPTWLIEEGSHRNAMFNLYNAGQMPQVDLVRLEVMEAPGGLHYVDIRAKNTKLVPTRSALAAQKKLGIPDRLTLAGEGITVVAGGTPTDRWRPEQITLQDHDPKTLRAESGVPGKGEWHARWIVAGSGPFTIRYEAEKATDRVIEGVIE